ncbi:MAG: hypothetical protein K6T99_06075 [Armatimonadetes bacterium]|nr:hypothetical protein [Armatimonadota bacterium]
MSKTKILFAGIITILVILIVAFQCSAGMMYEGRKTVTLSDGTAVTLLQSESSTQMKPQYYYLPTNLHLATKEDGTPQFLFLKFTTEQREEAGGIKGGLLHFLMEFGLTKDQEAELLRLVREKEPKAEILGAAPVVPDGETSTFQITSATLTDQGLTKSLITSGKAPLMPGQRVAAAARLTANGAQLLDATFQKSRSITDISLSFNLAYYTMMPAVEGTIYFHWSKLQQQADSLAVEYEHKYNRKCFLFWCSNSNHKYTYNETRQMFDFLCEKEIIVMNFKEKISDERTAKIRDAFFQFFLNSFAESEQVSPEEMLNEEDRDKSGDSDPKAPAVRGDSYKMSHYKFAKSEQMKDRFWYLKYSLPYRETLQLTANLAEWYDGVRNNPKCVAAVNLNDPFFTHRDIKFILDLDAKEIFDEAVNYVTVNVRKKRTSGRDFEDHVTIDANYLKNNGVTASVTYARGDDSNPDVYEYQAQWSLKGGNIYPANPQWMQGSWEGVTLTPPVRPITIEFEGDLDAMKEKDITRCTAQLHYYQFGKEVETNIHLSPTKKEPLVSAKIFMDRDKKNYAYRLIYNHKTAGKLVGPWVANVSDEYIYATIPDDLLITELYKKRAESLVTGAIERVLEKLGM